MKPRNISFAQVLKNKGRSPQPEVSRAGLKLSELLQQWEQFPNEDYTLQLGNIGLSQRSRNSTIRMFCSKNNAEEEEEMFDSWIQRQSFVNSNKENIGMQPKRMMGGNEAKQVKKIVLSSKGKEGKMTGRTMGELVRQAENRQMEESSRGAPCSQVQMIKSNFQQEKEAPRISISRSPRAMKPQEEEMQLELQEITLKAPPMRGGPNKEGLRKELSKITEQKMEEMNKIMQEPRKKVSRVEQLISENENIHNEIADMAKEIVRQNAYNREESEDEELLIGDSEKKPYMPEPKREPFFRGERPQRDDRQDDADRRIQEARNVVGGVLKNFNMGRIGGTSNKSSNAVSTEQLRAKPIEEPKAPAIPVHYQVGYSFASNMIDTQRDESLSDLQIQQIKSQLPTPKMQQSQDLQFRKKYLSNINMPVVPDEHIKNIQSIRYETECHEDAINSMPNSSFEVQLINSEAKRYEDSYSVEPEKQEKPEIMVNLPSQYDEKAKETVKQQAQSSQPAKISFTNVFEQYASKVPMPMKDNSLAYDKREYISNYMSPKINEMSLMTSGSKYERKEEEYKGEPFSTNIEPVSSKRDYEFEHETVEKIVQQMQSPKMEEQPETKNVTSPTTFKDIKASNTKFQSYHSIKDIKESPPVQANPSFSSISIPKQDQPSPPQSSNNYSSPTYTQPVPSYLASYNQSSYAQNNYVSSPTNVPSYSNNYSTSTYQTGATYATYQPAKPYTSPKTFDYATPTPISTYTPSTFTPSTTFTPAISTYQPAKIDYISVPPKPDATPSTLTSYQQKYTLTSTTTVEPKSTKQQKIQKKSYLTQLDIKQSITLQEPKPKHIPLISKPTKSSFSKPDESSSLFKQSLKQSIKQSINLNASGESQQFQFEF